MIEHAKIFISIISLMIGTWAVVYAFQMYKSYAFSFLKLIAHYTFLSNLGFLILLITKYIEINLSENFMSNVFPYYKDITELVIILIEIGLITLMLKILLVFQEKDISPRFKGWVGAAVIILILSYGIKMILPHASSSYRWFDIVQSAIFSNLIILEFPILIGLLIIRKKGETRDKTRIIQSFATLYLSRWVLAFIFIFFNFTFAIPDPLRLLTAACHNFLFNIVPLIWIRYYFLEYAKSILKHVEERAVLATIFEKHNITKREQDIVKLLLGGKSNREIADSLFIAIPTVKNHIHSLYQKFRVKTRYELIHFILKY